jgi:hypothetical protein
LHGIQGGKHESRTGFEDRVSSGGNDLFGFNLPLGDLYATRTGVVYDAQSYVTLGVFLLLGIRNPWASRSLIAFTAWSSFAHAAVMDTQALRNMISRGELMGVAILVLIGAALITLTPTKHPTEPPSRRSSYQRL